MTNFPLVSAPDYAYKYEFIVARECGNRLWFYGAYKDGFKADQVASEINGVVIHNVQIQGYQP